jgi:hypothetical protein
MGFILVTFVLFVKFLLLFLILVYGTGCGLIFHFSLFNYFIYS